MNTDVSKLNPKVEDHENGSPLKILTGGLVFLAVCVIVEVVILNIHYWR